MVFDKAKAEINPLARTTGKNAPLGPLCAGVPPAGGRGENLFPGDYDYIRQGRGHNVCLTVSRDGAEQAVDVCFDLSRWPLTAG